MTDAVGKEASKKVVTEPTKHYVPVQSKDKVDEIINVEGSTSKLYSQVNNEQQRIEADKTLEEEINK
ncbi:hypothetical protein A2U01_0046991, partial [Trifolium medium]|nr:hypothetical protein [Trifolium medium]